MKYILGGLCKFYASFSWLILMKTINVNLMVLLEEMLNDSL